MAPYDEQKPSSYHLSSPLLSMVTPFTETSPSSTSISLRASSLIKRRKSNKGDEETVIDDNSTIGIRKLGTDPLFSSKDAMSRVRNIPYKFKIRRMKSKNFAGSKLLLLLSFKSILVVLGICCFIAHNRTATNPRNSLEATINYDRRLSNLPPITINQLRQLRKKQEGEQQQQQKQATKGQIIPKEEQRQQKPQRQEQAFFFEQQTNNSFDKQPILNLLKDAGMSTELDKETYDKLPTWKQITDLYGTKPRFHGLETCEKFRSTGDQAEHFLGTAGTFNTGTNLMSELLIANCHMQHRMDKYGEINKGIRWQVPWGKHSPPGDEEFRLNHKTKKDKEDSNSIFPAVTIRDPYNWLRSMCRHQYTANWSSSYDGHCPNLVPSEKDKMTNSSLYTDNDSVKVNVEYSDFRRDHDSLVHMWNDWYKEYINIVTIPRILVRYEDLLFFPKETITTVCECAGGSMKKDGEFNYIMSSAKKGNAAHGEMNERTGYVDAIVKYGTDEHRYDGFHEEDLQYVRDHVNNEFMKIFGYRH